ncbi:hypothetical protein EV702DRAFT_1051012 [Suillus placidus]|uniref:Uncharacterized protein n=1 Tax=Suillus placidus TaxID=48579 RepID=A0A9P6ZHK6_9AGAM|nr:hypothetical protein EV702DRAFT_1051012 [Suillus placidus]
MNGFSLHRLEDAVCIRTYNTNPVKTFPKQVVFGVKATLVVGGSDTGVIYVFDKNEGMLKQVLQHANNGQVQTVTTYNNTHHSLIFGAMSMNDTELTISIWCQKWNSVAKSVNDRPLVSALKSFVWGIAQLAIAMAMIAYILGQQNTSPISLTLLGNVWREYSNSGDQPQDLADNVHFLVEKYIEDQRRGKGLERAQSSVENQHSRQVKPIILGSEKLHDEDMHAMIILRIPMSNIIKVNRETKPLRSKQKVKHKVKAAELKDKSWKEVQESERMHAQRPHLAAAGWV